MQTFSIKNLKCFNFSFCSFEGDGTDCPSSSQDEQEEWGEEEDDAG